jgi:uncharacterized iron-regulated protein
MDSYIMKRSPHKGTNLKSPLILIALTFLLAFTPITSTADDKPHTDAAAYALSKFKSHDIVFLGVRHKQPRIENFISNLIPYLQSAGVSHVCLEIPSDQQGNLDHYMKTGQVLSEIQLWPQIDSPEYSRMLLTMHEASLIPVAIDLPETQFNQGISRDEYMAQMIAGIYEDDPDKKILVILGNRHALKKVDWEDHVPSQEKTIYQDLNERFPEIRMFSIGQVIGYKPEDCDFTRVYSEIDGIIAMDCTEQFTGWKIGVFSVMAIKDMEVGDVLDGVLVW